jgi:hypothetical protein
MDDEGSNMSEIGAWYISDSMKAHRAWWMTGSVSLRFVEISMGNDTKDVAGGVKENNTIQWTRWHMSGTVYG